MIAIEPLRLSAKWWRFLSAPEKYVEASTDRKLVLESTRRQFLTARDILARLTGSGGEEARRGVLLADDVGLGKTTVAALVAWVVASAGERRRVRVLAPNDVMMRRWVDELRSHVQPLQECAPALGARVRAGKVRRLKAGSIQVAKQSYALSGHLDCDLLIIDEAHRAKGDGSGFSKALKRKAKYARRVLILTATPFSIHLDELNRMLTLIGAQAAHGPVRGFDKALKNLYSGSAAQGPEVVAERLVKRARAAVEALAPFVIRHGIDDLGREQKSFGECENWSIDVPPARPEELELLMRMDRALRVAKDDGSESSRATNDPRFHVGWRHFDSVGKGLKRKAPQFAEPARAVVKQQLQAINGLREKLGAHHSKMAAVAAEVEATIRQGEKVVLFCHHVATAQELTVHLNSALPKTVAAGSPNPAAWRLAWDAALEVAGNERHDGALRDTFIKWLCSDLIRAQTWTWVRTVSTSTSGASLASALKRAKSRHPRNAETIAQAAQRLYHGLIQSKSSKAVLREATDRDRLELLPGANGAARVLGVCPPSESGAEGSLFLHNQQPDTIISIFNSPFGPDVLVVTDRLSEGIDLHRYCRHLIHYELDPSPIRTVQRNGRLRRVNSWAAATGRRIRYAYPAFSGTRDHRLVQIMKKRIDSFSLLLGGVRNIDLEEVEGSEEDLRNQVIARAKARLVEAGGRLRAQEPALKPSSNLT